MTILVLDLGVGNLASLAAALEVHSNRVAVASDASSVLQADRLVIPGVGSFDKAMKRLNLDTRLRSVLEARVLNDGAPVLGICLGMQIMARNSEEGDEPGLNWLGGTVKRLQINSTLKVPHVGWNTISPRKATPLLSGLTQSERFYFSHSYFLDAQQSGDAASFTHHGRWFPSVVQHKNIFGVQFHPEKSHKAGRKLLSNFARF